MQVWARTDTQLRCVVCRSRNIKGRRPWTRSLCTRERCAISAFDFGALSCVQELGMDVAHSLRVMFPGIAEGSTICGTNVRLRERPAGYFMLRCDRQDLTLQAILSNGSLLSGRPLGECSAQWPLRGRGNGGRLRRAWLRTVEQHPAATDAFTPWVRMPGKTWKPGWLRRQTCSSGSPMAGRWPLWERAA